MKIQNNITIFTGDTSGNAQAAGKARENRDINASNGQNKSIYAGNLLPESPLRDRLQQRKAQAQERAMKIVGDTWDGDRKIDEQLNQSRERLKDLRSTYNDARVGLKALEEKSQADASGGDSRLEEHPDRDAAGNPEPGQQDEPGGRGYQRSEGGH